LFPTASKQRHGGRAKSRPSPFRAIEVAGKPANQNWLGHLEDLILDLPSFFKLLIDGEFTEHYPAESIKEQSADQAVLGVADHRPTRDTA
jgi:hypothetical protein